MAQTPRSSTAYVHRQTSLWPTAVLAIPAIIGLIVTSTLVVVNDVGVWSTTSFAVLLLVAVVRFPLATLETEVADRPLGPTTTIAIADITPHEQVRLTWYYGFGGREWLLARRATLWSSSGRDAIEVRHVDGRGRDKRVYIGSDDAGGLAAALTAVTRGRTSG